MARRSSRRSGIPLKYRLPNPSPLFVGREDEIAWLVSTLERTPLALVRGPGGLGKTSLVLHTLASAFAAEVERTVFLPIPPGEPPDQVRLTIAHVLAVATGARDDVDIAGLRGDPEELTTLALDLAEEGSLWVVLDDLQHSDDAEMDELLRQLASYARQSRWIVTTRSRRELPELEGRSLDLDRLAGATLAELARAIDPGRTPDDVQQAISASAGSPWLLKQYMAAGAEGVALSREGVLSSMSEEARRLLRVLTLVESDLSSETIASFQALPPKEELRSLATRGLLVSVGDGWSVHDLVAEHLFPSGDGGDAAEAAERGRLAQALAERAEPEATLEALRLHWTLGNVDTLVELLTARGDELMALGFAPRVWAIVGAATDRRLGLWQLRCAAELGNATVLSAVHPPELVSEDDQLAWAHTQYLLGEREEARRLALSIADGSSDCETSTEARILAARCLLHLGRATEAAAELSGMGASTGGDWSLRALSVLVDACLDGEGAAARCSAMLSSGEGQTDPEALLDVATAYYRLGERRRADALVDRVLATPRGGRARLLVARRALLLRARLHLDLGNLAEVERLLELVRPYARGTSILRPFVIELDGSRRLATGDLEGLADVLERGVELARDADIGVARRLVDLGDRLKDLNGQSHTATDGDMTTDGASVWEPADEVHVRERLEEARTSLFAGNVLEAIDLARAARREAATAELRLIEADALLVLADALWAGLHVSELEETTEAIAALGESLGSARLLHHAAFYEGLAEAGVLERLASQMTVAPVVARRARALLGGNPALDTGDELVLAAARTAWDGRAVQIVSGAPTEWAAGWGLDAVNAAVWLPDGKIVSLQRKMLLFRVLTTLADRGGEASKEELICDAWGEAEYHPLKHDSKLHVSIRSLRKVIEDDPSTPTRLLTTDEGYALGGIVRRVEAV